MALTATLKADRTTVRPGGKVGLSLEIYNSGASAVKLTTVCARAADPDTAVEFGSTTSQDGNDIPAAGTLLVPFEARFHNGGEQALVASISAYADTAGGIVSPTNPVQVRVVPVSDANLPVPGGESHKGGGMLDFSSNQMSHHSDF